MENLYQEKEINEKRAALKEEQPKNNLTCKNIITPNENQSIAYTDTFENELHKEAQSLILHSTAPFPLSLFPEPIEKFIKDTAEALSCPNDFVGIGVLVVASVAIGNAAYLELKNSWVQGCSLYSCVIAEPGSAKTPALKKAMQPLMELQDRNYEEYKTKRAQYQLEIDNYDLEYEKWKQSSQKKIKSNVKVNEEKPIEPKAPSFEQLITIDSTIEAMYEILSINKRGIVKYNDELLGFIKGMNQYRSGADRQHWLSMWSNEPVTINRKGKEPIEIKKPFVSIIGGIQPDMIEEMFKNEGKGFANDGFMDRFLPSYPDPIPSKWTNADVSDAVVDGYREVINNLYFNLSENKPLKVSLSEKAMEAYTAWFDVTEDETNVADFPDTLKGAWRKLKGQHPRILLIMHLLRCASDNSLNKDVIDEETVIYTNYLMEYFKLHTKKVFQYTQSNFDDQQALKIIEYTVRKGDKHEKGKSIRLNDLNRGKVFGRSTNIEAIYKTIEQIEAQGLGEMECLKYKNTTVKQFVLFTKTIKELT